MRFESEAQRLERDHICEWVVHDEEAFGEAPWPAIRSWLDDTGGMVAFLRLPLERQQEIARGE